MTRTFVADNKEVIKYKSSWTILDNVLPKCHAQKYFFLLFLVFATDVKLWLGFGFKLCANMANKVTIGSWRLYTAPDGFLKM